jgi:guanylate kinase
MEATDKTKSPLKHLAEFERLLAAYQPSPESLRTLQSFPLMLLVGPTAAGRNTLINLLLQTGRYHYIVSDTTRKPRVNNGVMEKPGREYWFRNEEEFLRGLMEGAYLEAAIIHRQQVSGISIAELEAAKAVDKIPIDEIEVVGTENIHRYKPDALCIFLLPPSFEVWMRRLRDRGEMPEIEVRRRMQSAEHEIAVALEADYYLFVINTEINEAAVLVDSIANGQPYDQTLQEMARSHAEQLAIDIQIYLNNSAR